MHPTTYYDYDSETRYEDTHLAFDFWANPCVFPVAQHKHEHKFSKMKTKAKSADINAILRSEEMKAWLNHWVQCGGALARQKEILKLRQRTSLPRDLQNIPMPKNGSTIVNKEKSMKYQRRKALQKEENWRNEMTVQMLEN
mmetsp:Transcript_13514/g.20576  ORF Transcript_13514/g.20576 Transcript_13514/m.20576 type:complete len:141 (-) Transcript_13514:44-466(-)